MALIGIEIAKMHLADIIHGDLTTSNMMLRHPSSFHSVDTTVSTELVRISHLPQLCQDLMITFRCLSILGCRITQHLSRIKPWTCTSWNEHLLQLTPSQNPCLYLSSLPTANKRAKSGLPFADDWMTVGFVFQVNILRRLKSHL